MIIQLENNPTAKEINRIRKEMKTALPYTKQYLEGMLYVLEKLYENNIIIPKSLQEDYKEE